MKTMSLTQHLNPAYLGDHTPEIGRHLYRVTKVMNSIEPEIGDCLTSDEVHTYCHLPDWKVVIT